ncbi:hypothetical protein J4N45_10450 [Vibrio sp. SCSIO 43140]|uniref:hypothetical protein n=1 Tax=Vibrio sp. SCSIO 43140 TaxID=2819100 RepID=UPI0020750924|nr:hypothetical protein [Vibrio sp. SCSIO 43140]USD58950.1 hypothetical protein J4N45_10450 [Vibrio sp. SCSIO 43140]
MKLTSKQARHICTNPKAHMDFVLRGAVPSEKPAPMTPLRQLIESIPTSLWREYQGIRLSPEMGFNCSFQFRNLHQLYNWLGGGQTLIGNKRLPYQSYLNRRVVHVSLETLQGHCVKYATVSLKRC